MLVKILTDLCRYLLDNDSNESYIRLYTDVFHVHFPLIIVGHDQCVVIDRVSLIRSAFNALSIASSTSHVSAWKLSSNTFFGQLMFTQHWIDAATQWKVESRKESEKQIEGKGKGEGSTYHRSSDHTNDTWRIETLNRYGQIRDMWDKNGQEMSKKWRKTRKK